MLTASKSMPGRCAELSDLLERLAGEDLDDMSEDPDFHNLSASVNETIQRAIRVLRMRADRNAARSLDGLATEPEGWPLLSDLVGTGTVPVERMADIAHQYPDFWQFHQERFA